MAETFDTARSRDRRRSPRRRHQLRSNVGTVVDISSHGIRVYSPRRLKGEFKLRLHGPAGKMTLASRVVWHRRLGIRQHAAGLEFDKLSPQQLSQLTAILSSTQSRRREALGGRVMALGVLILAMHAAMGVPEWSQWLISVGLKNEWHSFIKEIAIFVGAALVFLSLPLMLIARAGIRRKQQTTEPMPAQRFKQDARALLRSVLASSPSGVLVLNANRDEMKQVNGLTCTLMNAAAEHLLGHSEMELTGKDVTRDLSWFQSMKLFDDVMSVIRTEMPFMAERRNPTDNKWYYIVVTQHGDGVTLNFTDISERKRYESRLEHAALHDTLTCLPNRKALEERLEQAIHRRKRVANYDFAVLFLDFDRFKIINDSLGHEAGDELLIKIADKLLENLRTGDTASRLSGDHLPARLGGDEFVILLDGITDKRDSVIVADRLLQTFLEPHHIAGHNVTSTASIGIVISGDGYDNAEDVLRDADTAMYHAKHKGKARYEIFDRNMHVAVVQRMTIEKELRETVENGAFTLEYEPIVALDTGRVEGFEALIRWPHPTRGIIPPNEFIGIAEELGLITAMGQWVLEKACAQLQEWSKKKGHEKVFVNVNLSKLQLRDPNLVPTVKRLIRKTKIRPGSLRLEITETMVMDDLKQISIVLGHLKSLGVQLAMDDFGTGHSSLNSLHRFPIDILKIDRSFIDTKDQGTSAWSAIIPATIALAHRLELVVVAEGVEKVDQLEMLRGLSCDYAQGHLFSKSLSAAEASQYMDQVQGFGDKASAA